MRFNIKKTQEQIWVTFESAPKWDKYDLKFIFEVFWFQLKINKI